MINDREFNEVLKSVPLDYYQKGSKTNPLQKYWHTTKINFALRLLAKLSFKNCLDVGSASGYMISEIAKRHPKARFHAIDAYKGAVDYAKKRYPRISFSQAEAEKLPYKNEQFDLILCYETIEHVRNPERAMREIRRVLKKDGKFVLAMDSGTLAFRIVWFFWEKTSGSVWQGAHLNCYHYSELEKLVLKSGFKILERHFTHFGLEVVFLLEKKNSRQY